MPNMYTAGAYIDIGFERESQEDYAQVEELDYENLLCVIADGSGSGGNDIKPAPIVVTDIVQEIKYLFNESKETFLTNPALFLKNAMMNANRVLAGFKLGNEEKYYGYASSVTCLLCGAENTIYVAHSGNTRLYVLRDGALRQMTTDHTAAYDLLRDGVIDQETYYLHPGRLQLTSGIGYIVNPEIQSFKGKIRDSDLLVLTTDGVHYAVRPEAMASIILDSADVMDAAYTLVQAANSTKINDNVTAMVVHKTPKEKPS